MEQTGPDRAAGREEIERSNTTLTTNTTTTTTQPPSPPPPPPPLCHLNLSIPLHFPSRGSEFYLDSDANQPRPRVRKIQGQFNVKATQD
ncbi:hypothetical protein E2C01_034870 [Portunus trituberculatus]|uniref:Uncharacterized protein n=1 Tax=Portunus trituberculatus TaxID=210409 RepID=A0A5B7F3Z7_PORTR|nr:hypothetical protein [Portunus trituberculatus]